MRFYRNSFWFLFTKTVYRKSFLSTLQESWIINNVSKTFVFIKTNCVRLYVYVSCFYQKHTSFFYSAAFSIKCLSFIIPWRILEGTNLRQVPIYFSILIFNSKLYWFWLKGVITIFIEKYESTICIHSNILLVAYKNRLFSCFNFFKRSCRNLYPPILCRA